MSINNNMHQSNAGNRYFSQSFNPQALNLLQTSGGLGAGSYNLLTNNQPQTAGFPLQSLNSQAYASHYGMSQQISNIPTLNHHSSNPIISNTSNLLITPQSSRNFRQIPPPPGSVLNNQTNLGNIQKNQPTNIQKRRNEIEIQGVIENLPQSQKKIKIDNFSLSDVTMLIEPENRAPINYKIYDLSQYEISKEIDEKIQNTKKILEEVPKIKPNFISLQCCETAKLQVDLFRIKYIFSDQFLIDCQVISKYTTREFYFTINNSFSLSSYNINYFFNLQQPKDSLMLNLRMSSKKIYLKILFALVIISYLKKIILNFQHYYSQNNIEENPQSKNLKKVYCLVEDISRLMNILKLDKENEAKLNDRSVHQTSNQKGNKKRDEDNKNILQRQGPGRRRKRINDSDQESDQQNIEEEDSDQQESQSRDESENISHSQSQSAVSKKKIQKKRILKKKRTLNKRVQEDDDSDFIKSDDSEQGSEDEEEDDCDQSQEMEQESSQQPIKAKKRILRRKKSMIDEDTDEEQDEVSNNKNSQDESVEKPKNKRGRRILQKNRLSKGKNRNAIESDDEEESFSMSKRDKNNDDSADIDNIKLVRKQLKPKLQIDDDEDKDPLQQVQKQSQNEQAKVQPKTPSVSKQNIKVENETKIEMEEEQPQTKGEETDENDIKVEEKIEYINTQQTELKPQMDLKVENKLLQLKEKELILQARSLEMEKRQKHLQDQQQKLLLLSLQYNASILEQKHAAVNLDIVNKHTSIS